MVTDKKAAGRILLCGTGALLCASAVLAQAKPAADLIITNAKIWTVDKAHPQAEALAVMGERIVAVGSAADVDAWHGPQTKILDAKGKLLLPGFNDSHVPRMWMPGMDRRPRSWTPRENCCCRDSMTLMCISSTAAALLKRSS
jgi:hypothetical protein